MSLLAERLAIAFSALILWTGLFLTIALFGLEFPFIAVVFWLGLIGFLLFGAMKFNFPQENEIYTRLEEDSRVRHRPLRSRKDHVAGNPAQGSLALWKHEKQRRQKILRLLSWAKPEFHLARRDPYALRIALLLLLITAFVVAGSSAQERISHLLIPVSFGNASGEQSSLKILIIPPAYTQKPYVMLNGRPKDPLPVPQGSSIRVTLDSWAGHLTLHAGDQAMPLIREGKTDIYKLERKIPETDSIKITQFGFPRLSIPIAYIRDEAPVISLRGKPETLGAGQLRLPLTVRDDYGLKLIRVRAILSPGVRAHPLGDAVYEEQSIIISTSGKPVDINPTFDLTGHPWAGYPVSLLVEAEDHAGQAAQAEPVEIVLPQRNFRHPVARTIAGIRKMLIGKGTLGADATMMALAGVLSKPQKYNWDTVVTLALRSAAGRINYEGGKKGAFESAAILWPAALRLEDGNLTSGQSDVRKALQALQKAMQEGASPEEVARMMQEFKDALANYLSAMQKELQKKVSQGELTPLSPDMMTQTLDAGMLDDFLSQLENEMINGNLESAMKKLESLQKLTDMLDPSMAQGLPEHIQKDMQDLEDLQNIIDRQQSLLDETRSLEVNALSQAEKTEQDSIGVKLNRLEKPDGQTPRPLQEAGEEMEQSSEQLGRNKPEGSVPHQQGALDALREGRKQMQQALQKKMQQMTGISMGAGAPRPYDPLGRGKPDNGRNIFDEKVEIPSGSERKKADEILKIIRERSSDLNRPLNEREYYQRLLRQW